MLPESVDRGRTCGPPYAGDPALTLFVDEPPRDASLLGRLRKRLNRLINEDLRMTFGQ